MERVQFQQEQMLAELKDLVQKGLFTQSEIKQIMKKRTVFETVLVRRIPKKGDFLRYAAYEMNLEALRRKRAERLGLPKGPPTISDFALIRRQFQVFERALKKFKDDIGLWVQYIQAAQRAQARALVSRICGRALQLHPNSPSLYILAASHELKHLSHAAARVLLQRGIRLNSENVDLWREYVKMELGFAEALRRRWDVLGLKVGQEEVGDKGVENDVSMDDLSAPSRTEGADGSSADTEIKDEQARKEILNGALVKTVISGAVKAIPTPELFSSIHKVLGTYPCPAPLRRSLVDHLHSLLHSRLLQPQTEPGSSKASKINSKSYAHAAKLYATRYLTPDLEGEALVDALRKANEDLMKVVHIRHDDEVAVVYTEFVDEWFEKGVDDHLNLYLLASLQSLCSSTRTSSLYAGHLRLLRSPRNPAPLSPSKLLRLARKYTSRCPKAVGVWLLRLIVELSLEGEAEGADWRRAWEDARRQFLPGVAGDASVDPRRDEIWLYGIERQEGRPLQDQIAETEALLRETRAEPSSTLSEKLLIRYIHLLHRRAQIAIQTGQSYKRGDQSKELTRIASRYLPSVNVWPAAFDIFSQEKEENGDSSRPLADSTLLVDEQAETEQALRTIYNTWRLLSPEAHGNAALKWAGWLVRHARGGDAARVVANARAALGMNQVAATKFDRSWRDIVDEMEKGGQGNEQLDEDSGVESD